ncbi:hypothetical protein [Lysobacter enzymogenes]|uniref:hypothetical protein n=1 Tax=Lysobacter enzymogenes TaxID=69 RepID=UPI001A97B99A|nr:hypothetical protein [Lysobacter enzymogenes]QQP95720.1 hypothetical protein JHW38_21235 [Lysobacter enzymogenes]
MKLWIAQAAIVVCLSALVVAAASRTALATETWLYAGTAIAAAVSLLVSRRQGWRWGAAAALASGVAGLTLLTTLGLVLNLLGS